MTERVIDRWHTLYAAQCVYVYITHSDDKRTVTSHTSAIIVDTLIYAHTHTHELICFASDPLSSSSYTHPVASNLSNKKFGS